VELRSPAPSTDREEAYWVGNSISGALYVLGQLFLRISVGGVREDPRGWKNQGALPTPPSSRL